MTLLEVKWCHLRHCYVKSDIIMLCPISEYSWTFLGLLFKETKFKGDQELCEDEIEKSVPQITVLSSLGKQCDAKRWFLGWIFSSPEPKAPRWAISIPVTLLPVRLSVVRPSVNIFKHLLLWNHWANWTQISYGDSLGWGNESLFKFSLSHDQDGRHAHIW